MAYIINRFNGTQLVTVEDGTLDQTTDIKLVGKNYNGYGEAQNENMLHLLEHFAGTSAPTKALSGQVWFDAGTNKLKFYTGSAWKNAGGAEVAATEPVGLNEGDLWYNTTANQLYAKTATGEFILVGPQSAGDGTTQMLSSTVVDDASSSKSIIIALINDTPLYIISNAEFTLNATQAASVPTLTGFTKIKKGITLVDTNSTTGVTTGAGGVGSPVIWGTASDALKLNGVSAGAYLSIDGSRVITLTEAADGGATVVAVRANDNGLTIGNSNDLQLKVTGGTVGYLGNVQGNEIQFAAARSAGAATHIASIKNSDATNAGIIPSANSLYNLGTSALKWATVHADTFSGIASQAGLVTVSGTGRSAATTATANTIAARDSSGNLTATLFNGTATKARYADLAEKYTTAEEHAVGTCMTVAGDTLDAEAKPASSSDLCIGVISLEPAFMMNSEIDGQYIGLKGRVPVRVSGVVNKGQLVYAWENGVASTIATRALVGIALETNGSLDEKLVECVLKV
jgi:hypothetical protein